MPDTKRPARRAFDPRLLEGSIPRALFLLAVPIMGANILQVAYQVIDAFWVGRLGAAAVASVSITMPVMFVLIGIGYAITPALLRLMGVAPAVYEGALWFMRIVFITLPFTFIYAMSQALMRGVGEVKAPLYIVAGTVAVNFVLDPVLIFGWFGFPAW